jgi:hydrogenase nickel incorporation protein HypA/HybF
MHELSVCLSLIEQIQRVAEENGAQSVTRIELSIGPLSGVEPELLRNAYPLAVAGTIAGDAELIITISEIRVTCNECGAESAASVNRLVCGECGNYRTEVTSGDELILQRLELADTR